MKYSYQPIDFAWASLGINYVIDAANWNPLEDPEKLIIRSLEPFYKDPRLLSMFLAWAEEYDELINVGRLGAYLGGLNPFELSMLGAISLKRSRKPNHRSPRKRSSASRPSMRSSATSPASRRTND